MMDLKGTNYWKICGDCFNLLKQFLPVQEDDEYWETVVDEANQIYEKYKQTDEQEFAKKQIFSVLDEFERIWKKQRKRGELS